MRLLNVFTLLGVFVAGVVAAAPVATPLNMANGPIRQEDFLGYGCEGVDWKIPCEKFRAYPDETWLCMRIQKNSVLSRSKSFILPLAPKFPHWRCRFHPSSGCIGEGSCYVVDTRRDSGCRGTWSSYWCVDDLHITEAMPLELTDETKANHTAFVSSLKELGKL